MDEQTTLLEQIMAYDFALYDLQLFLDTHPSDENALRDYKMAHEQSDNLRKQFQSRFGPLTARYLPNTTCWQWINDPWPWDYRGGMNNVDL